MTERVFMSARADTLRVSGWSAVFETEAFMADMVLHPRAQRLRAELADENKRLMDLLVEIDDIKLQQNPQIEADYAVKVGYLENELLARQVEARRARRALELARAAANRGEALDAAAMARIERQLDDELSSWRRKLDAALERAQKLLERRAGSVALSSRDARELKRLYRELAKRLHPDMHPELGEDARKLFASAQRMYQAGDVEGLRALAATVRVLMGGDGADGAGGLHREADVLDELETELIAARGRVEAMRGRLVDLRAAFPYAWRDKLADPAWVVEQSEELHRRITEAERVADAYREKLDALRREAR